MSWLAGARERLAALFFRTREDAEMDEELQFHLEQEAALLRDTGLDADEAQRRARQRLGGVQQVRDEVRRARGVWLLEQVALDGKLGLRMLRRSWGLTLVGGVAMTVAIAIAASVFDLVTTVQSGALPLEEGDRIVALQVWQPGESDATGASLLDVERWRTELRSVSDIGAFRTIERDLDLGDGRRRQVAIAEMSASGFRLTRVPPLLGRPLIDQDERPGSLPVVVIGYDAWREQFRADPDVVGRDIRFGNGSYSVVGVMPDGFAFPVNHQYWTPLGAATSSDPQRELSGLFVFARLAPGIERPQAEAELATVGALPSTRASSAPRAGVGSARQYRVIPYTESFVDDLVRWMARVVIVLIALLLVPPCANVAILVYARTVARQREMATRFVLGATRRRIVAQIFVEVLVLALLSGIAAIGVSRLVLWWLQRSLGVDLDALLPFWMDLRLSPMTVFFVSGLAVLAATLAGVVPALRATADPMRHGLRTSGGATMTLGARWTSLVVLQVAFTLAALPSAPELAWGVLRSRILGPGFAAETFLTAEVSLDRDALVTQGATTARLATLHGELLERVAADTDVLAVSQALTAPGQEPWSQIEIETSPASVDPDVPMFGHMTRLNLVDANFLEMFDVPILAGRGFTAADFAPEAAGVLISRSFAERMIGAGNLLGRRFRHLHMMGGATMPPAMAGRWFEIVGIVPDLPANTREATVYHPMLPGSLNPVSIVLRTRAASSGVPYRVRTTAAAVHPGLYLEEPWTLEEAYRRAAVGNYLGAGTLGAVTISVLLLSIAGIYALMSFTVNQRRKEIGIRSALGAGPRRLLAAILQRALGQVGAGAALGLTAAMILDRVVPVVTPDAENIPAAVPAAAAFMIAVAALAAAGPAIRALRLDPIEELRHD